MQKLKKTLSVFLSLLLVMSVFPAFDITVNATGNGPSGNYITFSSATSFTVNAEKTWTNKIEYSTNGNNWYTYAGGTDLTAAQSGGSGDYYLCFRGTGNTRVSASGSYTSQRKAWVITGTAVSCDGNIETLLNYTTVAAGQHPAMDSYCFADMFRDCTALIKAPKLPMTTLTEYCYSYMFYFCTALTEAPELPALTMATNCYEYMFAYCRALTEAPELPATSLANNCYRNMFAYSTGLIKAPLILPATTLTPYCYSSMFNYCTSLTNVPELPATTMTVNCYSNMFNNCKALTALPALPATTLADYCYYYMFFGCSGIKIHTSPEGINTFPMRWRIPSQANTEGLTSWNSDMFYNTGGSYTKKPVVGTDYYYEASNVPFVIFSSTSLFTINATKKWNGTLEYSTDGVIWEIYEGGTNLTAAQIGNMAKYCLCFRGTDNTHISALGDSSGQYSPWVITGNDVVCDGNIEYLLDYAKVKADQHPTMANYCFYRMFYNCTALTKAPELSATTLAEHCYEYMFSGCSSLTEAPVLPATTLASYCYRYMFSKCTSLRYAPALPATTLASYCYYNMFDQCTSLREAPVLPATTMASNCYNGMFYYCTALRKAPVLPATTLAEYCYASMFINCTSLTEIPKLQATALATACYANMFFGCTGIKLYSSANENEPFPATWSIPAGANGYSATNWNYNMLLNTGGDFTNDPVIGTTYHYGLSITPFVVFSSAASFTINATKRWNGTLEYSTDGESWEPYEGGTTLTAAQTGEAGDYYLCLRGTGNTRISCIGSTSSYSSPWIITGTDVACSGNIENLLDYTTVAAGQHPTMEDYCFSKMFTNCKALVEAPELPATTLLEYCYYYMFYGCTNLRKAPELPATTLAEYCYDSMFYYCSTLTKAPELPATTLTNSCYYYMFYGCTNLRETPALPATTLAGHCYSYMFGNCTSLRALPELSVKTLAKSCYYGMFSGCDGIKMHSTTEQIVGFPATWGIPEGATEDGAYNWNISMLSGTEGSFTGNPVIGTTYYYESLNTPFIYFSSPTPFTVNATKKWNGTVEYSTDGESWSTYTGGTDLTAAQMGSPGKYYLCLRGTGNTQISATDSSLGSYSTWIINGTDVTCGGNIENLLDYARVKAGQHPAMGNYCFYRMFYNCTVLIKTPVLPATALTSNCYDSMFYGCTNITEAPALPATTLASYCYHNMFSGCTSLGVAPVLPATTLASNCYSNMFENCTFLRVAPELSATTLAEYCYASMFKNCTALDIASELPATTLTPYCYNNMFFGCTGIELYTDIDETDTFPLRWRVPAQANAENASGWNDNMFSGTGGSFTGTPVVGTTYYYESPNTPFIYFSSATPFTINATKKWNGTLEYSIDGYTWSIYEGDTDLPAAQLSSIGNYYLCLRGTDNTQISATGYSSDSYSPWVITGTAVACNGNIENLLNYAQVKTGQHPTMESYCFKKMFYNCTALTTAPELPATTLAEHCYEYMFSGCSSLTEAPALPATTLMNYCYEYMFSGCSSLTEAPALPATTLMNYCYRNMFSDCTSLGVAPALPAITLASSCYASMFSGCSSLLVAPVLPATTMETNCYEDMFRKCSALREAPALPATTLESYCYYHMFYGCTALCEVPELPATTLADYCYSNMFSGCTGIKLYESADEVGASSISWSIPAEANADGLTDWNNNMFHNTGGAFNNDPVIGTVYYYAPVSRLAAASDETSIDASKGIIITDIRASTDISAIITPLSGYTVSVEPSLVGANASYNGTNTVITVKYGANTVDTYILVVMGDVNGDSFCDARDAVITELAMNRHTTLTGYFLNAADYDESLDVEIADLQQLMSCAVSV